jgi:hypothetical protein
MIPAASISESVDNATMGELRGIVPIAVAMSDSDPVPSSAEVSASDSSDIDKKGESSRGKKDKRDKKRRKKAGKSGDDGRPVPAGGSQPQSEEALHHSGPSRRKSFAFLPIACRALAYFSSNLS